MEILIYTIDEQQFGIPIELIKSVVLAAETTAIPQASEYFLGALNLHGDIIPVIDLRKLFDLPAKEVEVQDKFIICLIQDKKIALWIDQVTHIKQYKETDLIPAEQFLPDVNNLQYVLKDNEKITLLFNLEKILKPCLVQEN